MISAEKALQRLLDGNRRYVAETPDHSAGRAADRREALLAGQHPFAIILGCSDSRVPVGLIFDQGLGELFVVRVAGNVVAPSQLGSIELAADEYGPRLVVVLGHTHCGAVGEAVDDLITTCDERSPSVRNIIERIQPPVHALLAANPDLGPVGITRLAVRANIQHSVEQLRGGSPILERLQRDRGLLIVGAEYSLETGEVEFFATVDPD